MRLRGWISNQWWDGRGRWMQRGRGPVDEVDREIIRLLQRDGRTSNTDIARALQVTETTIRKRIARLIDEDLFNDHEHLLQFVSSKLGVLKGVTGAETSLILRVAKFSYEWEIP